MKFNDGCQERFPWIFGGRTFVPQLARVFGALAAVKAPPFHRSRESQAACVMVAIHVSESFDLLVVEISDGGGTGALGKTNQVDNLSLVLLVCLMTRSGYRQLMAATLSARRHRVECSTALPAAKGPRTGWALFSQTIV